MAGDQPTLSCWPLENSIKNDRGTAKNSPNPQSFLFQEAILQYACSSLNISERRPLAWLIHWSSSPRNDSSLTFRYITPVIPVLSRIPVTKQYWKCWWSMSVCSTAQINIKAAITNPHQAGASLFLMKPINALGFFQEIGEGKEKRNKNKTYAVSFMGHNTASLNCGIVPHPLSNHRK